MNKTATFLAAVALAAGGLTASNLVAPEPAAAASCSVSNLGWWSVKNVTCKSARHLSVLSNGVTKYGAWVGKGGTSKQSACWAGATKYGFEVKYA